MRLLKLLLISLFLTLPAFGQSYCNSYTSREITHIKMTAEYAEKGDYLSDIKRKSKAEPDTTLHRGLKTIVVYRWDCYAGIEYHFNGSNTLEKIYTKNVNICTF